MSSATTKTKKTGQELPTQREAVFSEIISLLKEEKIPFTEGTNVQKHLPTDLLPKLYTRLEFGFTKKKISLRDTASNRKKLADPKRLHIYVIGLVNNWVAKDERLNGKGKK